MPAKTVLLVAAVIFASVNVEARHLLAVSNDGSCGARNNGKTCPPGNCCSQFGYCGTGAPFCAGGCQSAYGICSSKPSPPSSPSATPAATSAATPSPTSSGAIPESRDGSCGAVAKTKCTPRNSCSQFGYCGSSTAYTFNCQPGYGGAGAPSPCAAGSSTTPSPAATTAPVTTPTAPAATPIATTAATTAATTTATPTPTPTIAATPAATPAQTMATTTTPTPTATTKPSPAATATPAATPAQTNATTITLTATPAATSMSSPTATPTVKATPAATAAPTATPTAIAATPAATTTPTATPTPTPVATKAPNATATATPTPTPVATKAPNATATATPTPTPVATKAPNATATATPTPTPVATKAPNATATATPTPTPVVTKAPNATATATPRPTPVTTVTTGPLCSQTYPNVPFGYTDSTGAKTAALTFDDAPDADGNTDKVLDALKAAGVKATFYVNGNNYCDASAPPCSATIARIKAEGHTLASHTLDHPHTDSLTDAQINTQFSALESAVGQSMTEYRLPFGEPFQDPTTPLCGPGGSPCGPAEVARVAKTTTKYGVHVGWTFDGEDFNCGSNAACVTKAYAPFYNSGQTGVILHHSVYAGTASALPAELALGKSKGYTFVTAEYYIQQMYGMGSAAVTSAFAACPKASGNSTTSG